MDALIEKSDVRAETDDQKGFLEHTSTYEVNGKAFIVTPVFQKDGSETLGSLLFKLMKSDTSA